jgi:hypothetical protein
VNETLRVVHVASFQRAIMLDADCPGVSYLSREQKECLTRTLATLTAVGACKFAYFTQCHFGGVVVRKLESAVD